MTARWIITGTLMLAMAALGVSHCVARAVAAQPFDEWYEDCQPEDATWHLVVQMDVPGQADLAPYEAYFRKRSSPLFAARPWPFDSGPQTIEIEELYCGGFWACYACGGGGGYSEHGGTFSTKTPDGIELEVNYERTGTSDRDLKVAESIVIPFGQNISGRQNQLTYQVAWQRVK